MTTAASSECCLDRTLLKFSYFPSLPKTEGLSACDEFRSRLPLRDSSGFTPDSLLRLLCTHVAVTWRTHRFKGTQQNLLRFPTLMHLYKTAKVGIQNVRIGGKCRDSPGGECRLGSSFALYRCCDSGQVHVRCREAGSRQVSQVTALTIFLYVLVEKPSCFLRLCDGCLNAGVPVRRVLSSLYGLQPPKGSWEPTLSS